MDICGEGLTSRRRDFGPTQIRDITELRDGLRVRLRGSGHQEEVTLSGEPYESHDHLFIDFTRDEGSTGTLGLASYNIVSYGLSCWSLHYWIERV